MSEKAYYRWLIWPFMDSKAEVLRLCRDDQDIKDLIKRLKVKYPAPNTDEGVESNFSTTKTRQQASSLV